MFFIFVVIFMRSFSKKGLVTLCLAMFIGSVTVTATSAQGPINEILKRMERHANALKSLSSNVTMSKHDTLLDEYDQKYGNINYLPGKGRNIYLRIDWTRPVKEHLIIVKGKYVLYTPRLKQAIRGKVSQANKNTKSGGALAFMSMSKAQLKTNYQIKFLGVETVGGVKMWHLHLIPKKKTSYKAADLWVNRNGMPVQSKIIEWNNDSTTIRLSNIKTNISIKATTFIFPFPKDIRWIDG